MQITFCANCNKYTGHKRAIGAGTVLGALVTGGASLLAVPAYGKRCVICGLTEGEANQGRSAHVASDKRLVCWTLGCVLAATVFIVICVVTQ